MSHYRECRGDARLSAFRWLHVALFLLLAGCKGSGCGSPSQPPQARFAYVARSNEQAISIFQVDAASGRLRPLGYVPLTQTPVALTVHPSGDWLFVHFDGGVEVRRIERSSGWIDPAAALTACSGARSATLSPNGGHLYCLTSHAGSPPTPGVIEVLRFDAGGPTLTSLGTVTTQPGFEVVGDPRLRFILLETGIGSPLVAHTLTLGNTTQPLSPTGTPLAVKGAFTLIHPSGRWAFTVGAPSPGQTAIVGMSVADDGTISGPISTLPLPAIPNGMKFNPAGTELLVFGPGRTQAFQIDVARGTLTNSGRTFPTPAPADGVVDPTGQFIYELGAGVINTSSASSPNGTFLSRIMTTWNHSKIVLSSGSQAASAAARFVVTSGQSGIVRVHAVNWSNGALTPAGDASTGATTATVLDTTADARFAYVGGAFPDSVAALSIDSGTGKPTAIGGPALLPGRLQALAVDRSGSFLCALLQGSGGIVIIGINPLTGALTTSKPPIPMPISRPASLTFSHSGELLFVTNGDVGGDILAFAVDPRGMRQASISVIRPLGRVVPSSPGTVGIALDPFDQYAMWWGATGVKGALTMSGGLSPSLSHVFSDPFISTVAMSPNGAAAFAVSADMGHRTGSVTRFVKLDPAAEEVPTMPGPTRSFSSLIVHPVVSYLDSAGQRYYLLDRAAGKIFVFNRHPGSGDLDPPLSAGATSPIGPMASAVTPHVPGDFKIIDDIH